MNTYQLGSVISHGGYYEGGRVGNVFWQASVKSTDAWENAPQHHVKAKYFCLPFTFSALLTGK
jgi:hypothetical protein